MSNFLLTCVANMSVCVSIECFSLSKALCLDSFQQILMAAGFPLLLAKAIHCMCVCQCALKWGCYLLTQGAQSLALPPSDPYLSPSRPLHPSLFSYSNSCPDTSPSLFACISISTHHTHIHQIELLNLWGSSWLIFTKIPKAKDHC